MRRSRTQKRTGSSAVSKPADRRPLWHLCAHGALLTVVSLSVTSPDIRAQTVGREEGVREAVAAFAQAYVDADVAALRSLLTEDYVHVNGGSGSVLDRERWLDWISQRREAIDAGELVIVEYEIGEMQIRLHGDVAVVVGSVASRERRDGQETGSRVRITNVWVRGDVGWRRAAFHDSPLG